MNEISETQDIDILELAREVLERETQALTAMRDRLDDRFERAALLMRDCAGKIVVTGMGKSGAVGRKIAATLSSTGTTAVYLHPGEGIHGDLGVLAPGDILLVLSQSGETDEVLALLPALRRLSLPIIALTGGASSTLAQYSEVVLDTAVEREACPMGLAPTSSTTCQMALGDALALCVMRLRRFTPDDYALYHPGGSLGRRLLLRAADLMRSGDQLAIVPLGATLKETLFAITHAHAGAAAVVDADGKMAGLVTDGDLRRYELKRGEGAFGDPVERAMTTQPMTISPETMAVEVLATINERARATGASIGEVPVVDTEGRPVGILMLKDIARAGILSPL